MTGRLIRHLALVSTALMLAACTSLTGLGGSSSYACKAPEGVACESVSGMYANAVQNRLPSQRQQAATAPRRPAPTSSAGTASPTTTTGEATSPTALRSSPRILRLWFKPWEDADHDLYDQGYVYVQIDAGRWQVEHVQRQIRSSFAPLKPPPRASGPTSKDALTQAPDAKGVPRPPFGAPVPTPPGTRPTPHAEDTEE